MDKRARLFIFLFFPLFTFALIQPSLSERMANADLETKLSVNIVLKDQFPIQTLFSLVKELPRPQRRAEVARVLRQFSEEKQRAIIRYLREKEVEGKVSNIVSLWLCNMVGCYATKEVIEELDQREEVAFIYYDRVPIDLPDPKDLREVAPKDAIEWNITKVRAPQVWQQGYTGEGVVVGIVDTGVRYTHYDLRNHLWTSTAYPNHGFNFASYQFQYPGHQGPSPYDSLTPLDWHGHGSHCAGTICSDGSAGDTCGVAPRARLLIAAIDAYIHTPYPDTACERQTMQGMEFCVSPPRDPTNGADVVSMSIGWDPDWQPRKAVWRTVCENILAAGVAFAIAAGNEGRSATPNNLRIPGACPPPYPHPQNGSPGGLSCVISVGATDVNDNLASFSSTGPSTWQNVPPWNDYVYPPGLTDPDICAPGVNITSLNYQSDNGYVSGWQGTSMATPHIAGAIALMLDKNPNLTPRAIDSILENFGCVDLGRPGKDSLFGAGRLVCDSALNRTPMPGPQHNITLARLLNLPDRIDPLTPVSPGVVVVNSGSYRENNIPVHLWIDSAGNSVYHQFLTIPQLDSAEVETLNFPVWNTGPGGVTYQITAYHTYSPDTNRHDDTLRKGVTTKVHDVATTGMNIGPRVRANSSFIPRIILTSADYTERNFQAFCLIDSAGMTIYNQTISIDSVPANTSRDFTFPAWTVGPVGTVYYVTMFHNLLDANRNNDTIRATTTSSQTIRALIVYSDAGGTPDSLRNGLRALGDSTELFSAYSATPTLAQLLPYDGVICFSNNTFYNPVALGDTLAAYVDAGGVVILATFAHTTGWHIQGRITTGPYATFVNGANVHNYDSLGWYLSSHPIMQGVNFVADIYRSQLTWAAGAESIAKWRDNKPYVAVSQNHKVVGINNYPGYYNNPNGPRRGDWVLVYHNALAWMLGGGVGLESEKPSLLQAPRLTLRSSNPVNNSVSLDYNLPNSSLIRIAIYNISGQLVKTLYSGKGKPGENTLNWNLTDNEGRKVSGGIYFCRLETENTHSSLKVILK